MNKSDLIKRTQKFALRIIKLVKSLDRSGIKDVLGRQVLKSGTSVGANYRSACRAKSLADFIAKLSIVEEECDETIYWLELIGESGIVKKNRLTGLIKEADEILAIIVASKKTARKKKK